MDSAEMGCEERHCGKFYWLIKLKSIFECIEVPLGSSCSRLGRCGYSMAGYSQFRYMVWCSTHSCTGESLGFAGSAAATQLSDTLENTLHVANLRHPQVLEIPPLQVQQLGAAHVVPNKDLLVLGETDELQPGGYLLCAPLVHWQCESGTGLLVLVVFVLLELGDETELGTAAALGEIRQMSLIIPRFDELTQPGYVWESA